MIPDKGPKFGPFYSFIESMNGKVIFFLRGGFFSFAISLEAITANRWRSLPIDSSEKWFFSTQKTVEEKHIESDDFMVIRIIDNIYLGTPSPSPLNLENGF